jgi:hypothetical protein
MNSEAFENGRQKAMERLGIGKETGLPPEKGFQNSNNQSVKITNAAQIVPGTISRKSIILNSRQQRLRQEALDFQARQEEGKRRIFGRKD